MSSYTPLEKFIYLAFATILGIFLFFQNPFLPNFFAPGSEDWYVNFSVMIFHPNEAYWNESILLPLLGKLTGASKSLVGYKVLCAFISMLILPSLAALSLRYFNRITNAYLFLICFAASFRYLWLYDLGHPDPLTILLLCSIPLLRSRSSIFVCAFLASLSHFSMALIAILELVILYWASVKTNSQESRGVPLALVTGLVVGRLFLGIWYWTFHYTSPLGRIEFILNSGISFFYDRYQLNPLGFWLTPGIVFLLINVLILSFFLFNKNWKLAGALLLTTAMSYAALFITVDGLRIFSAVCCGSYIFLLTRLIDSMRSKTKQASNQI
jgi:hypothetical protein